MNYADVYYRSNDGLRLYARDYAGPHDDVPAIFCLPGLTRNSKDFDALAEHLRQRYRVICPEQRGRGRSERDSDPARYRPDVYVTDMWTLADLLQLPRIGVVGTSLGGLMAILMAATAPARIDRIVINDVGPEIDPRGIARISGYVGKSAPVASWKDAASQTAQINGPAFPDYTAADWMAMARNVYIQEGATPILDYDPAISRGLASGTAAPNLWPLFDALAQKPVLAIRGELSDVLSEATFAAMAEHLPRLTAVVIPGRGHAPMLTEPQALAAIDRFLSDAA
jgi:pimeloyl-ACP methyl ester carboxylesterase